MYKRGPACAPQTQQSLHQVCGGRTTEPILYDLESAGLKRGEEKKARFFVVFFKR